MVLEIKLTIIIKNYNMAIRIKHSNNSNSSYVLQILIKDGGKNVQKVILGPNQEVWSKAHKITPGLRIYERKGAIQIEEGTPKKNIPFLTAIPFGNNSKTPSKIEDVENKRKLEKAKIQMAIKEKNKKEKAEKDEKNRLRKEAEFAEAKEKERIEAIELEKKKKLREEAKKAALLNMPIGSKLEGGPFADAFNSSEETKAPDNEGETSEEKKEIPLEENKAESSLEEEKSVESILDKASKQVEDYAKPKLKSGRWSEEEIKTITKLYPKYGTKKTAEKLNRSDKSVQKKAEYLKLRIKRK